MNVVVKVMTDKYPEDTSWELTNNCDGTAVPMKKDLFTDGYTLYTDADILPSAKYTFTLNDSYGDGKHEDHNIFVSLIHQHHLINDHFLLWGAII